MSTAAVRPARRRIPNQVPGAALASLLATGELSWMIQGACNGLATRNDDPWFPEVDQRAQTASAQRICKPCPVKDRCLRFALDARIDAGVWGGATTRQRRKMRGLSL